MGLITKLIILWRNWKYCNGCKYFKGFTCHRFEETRGMICGCCKYTRDIRKINE